AYGKYCNEHLLSRSPGHLLPGDDDYSGADGGSARAAGIRILTGKGVDDDLMMFTSEKELSKKLQMAMTAGRIVTAGIGKQLNSDNTTSNGLPGGHEYSVIDYDPETKLVTLRNPWGEGEPKDANGDPLDGTDDGVFTMTLADFRKHFTVINYQEA
ncbi:MAG TPA: C2 family cysteine protease, partial [Candidatus Obscuribacterales bacterium]